MINKIVYIGYQPLTDKVHDDFYLLNAFEHKFEIEYWDLSNIYFPGVSQTNLRSDYTVYINKFKDLKKKISNQTKAHTLFIIMITFESRVLRLFYLLTKYNCQIAIFARGTLPFQSNTPRSILFKIRKAFNPSLLGAFLKNKFSSSVKNMGLIKHYDLVFNAGELGFNAIGCGYQIDKLKSRSINVNSFDFDRFISTFKCSKIIKNKYCLFLDDYLPYHPDFDMFNIRKIDADEYYNILNKCFKEIENKYSMEVIIAAHPKAEKYKTKNPFNDRKIYFNKTAELTKFAEFTIAHCSTAISFSVLYMKPIIFLESNLLKLVMPNIYQLIFSFSKTLGSTLINMDNFQFNNTSIQTIDQLKYIDYKYKYLTSKESEGQVSSSIFIDAISKL
jgi:hypothetical protein